MSSTSSNPPASGRRLDLGRRVFRGGHITELEDLTPTSRRMRLTGPKLSGVTWAPGTHVRIKLGALSLRTYSVWDADPQQGWIDLVLFDHLVPDSIGRTWADEARVGQYVVTLRDPRTISLVPEAPWHLFAGEETAAPAFGSLMRALPATATVLGVQQANGEDDHLTLPRPLTRVERLGASAASSQQLVDAVAALDLPEVPGAAYLFGEARTIQMIRTHLVRDRGWRRHSIVTKPFWTPGKRGLD